MNYLDIMTGWTARIDPHQEMGLPELRISRLPSTRHDRWLTQLLLPFVLSLARKIISTSSLWANEFKAGAEKGKATLA